MRFGVCRVGAYPVAEQDRILWIWMGDPERADPSRIARFPWIDDPALRCAFGYTQVNAHYELLTDNLMDLTHARFLHPGSGGDLYSPRNSVEIDGDSVVSKYIVENIDNPEFPENAWSAHGRKVDLWDDIRWHAPATLSLSSGVVLTGRPRNEGCEIPLAHAITRETADRSHYFWGSALPKDSPLSNGDFTQVLSQAFDTEDKPMIEYVHRRMAGEDFWDQLAPAQDRQRGGARAPDPARHDRTGSRGPRLTLSSANGFPGDTMETSAFGLGKRALPRSGCCTTGAGHRRRL